MCSVFHSFSLSENTSPTEKGLRPLKVVGTPFVKERLTQLCQLAFPGSLDSMLEHITWVMDDEGALDDGWHWERFEVHHEDAVEPHGYRFEHEDGASFVHSGDSGPCEPLYEAIERSHLAVLEMGFPGLGAIYSSPQTDGRDGTRCPMFDTARYHAHLH